MAVTLPAHHLAMRFFRVKRPPLKTFLRKRTCRAKMPVRAEGRTGRLLAGAYVFDGIIVRRRRERTLRNRQCTFSTKTPDIAVRNVRPWNGAECNGGAKWDEVGTERDEVGTERDEVGTERDEVGTERDEVGTERDEVGTERDEVGTERDEVGTERR
ncbi:hypothetical protein, partial [Bifidobacterium parmae]|uniref:hypothetical protein n=1 Tax=Bifidobacterium parmae TaxID=361854 RepID=UPI001A9C6DCC